MAPLWMAMRISCGLLLIRDASLAYPVVTSLGKYVSSQKLAID